MLEYALNNNGSETGTRGRITATGGKGGNDTTGGEGGYYEEVVYPKYSATNVFYGAFKAINYSRGGAGGTYANGGRPAASETN